MRKAKGGRGDKKAITLKRHIVKERGKLLFVISSLSSVQRSMRRPHMQKGEYSIHGGDVLHSSETKNVLHLLFDCSQ